MVRLGRLERPLNALSTHSLCQLGYRRDAMQLEDQAGFEPALSFRCRLKRPARSTATVAGPMLSNGGPGWLRSTSQPTSGLPEVGHAIRWPKSETSDFGWIKSPLPLHSGLRLQVQLVLPPGAAPGSLAYRASALLLS